MIIPKNLQEKRDELAREFENQAWRAAPYTDVTIDSSFRDGFNSACNLLLPEIEKMVELLEGSLEVRNFEAPEDTEVKALGERIGFGALLDAAVKGWHQSAKENGYPPGGAFTVGNCHATVESALQSWHEFLEGGE